MTTPSAAPFERLQMYGESLAIDTTGKFLVLPTENSELLPSFNEWTLNPNRCNLTETPCGGFKNSVVSDYHPYSISVDGTGALLSVPSNAFSGIALGVGKLAETGYINNYTSALEYRTADGETYSTADNNQYFITGSATIIEEFDLINPSSEIVTCTLVIRCPDTVPSIKLYNKTLNKYESPLVQASQTAGTINSYTLQKTVFPNTTEQFILNVGYSDLSFSYSFSDDANPTTGLHNLSAPWIAVCDPDESTIQFYYFPERPTNFSFTQSGDTITQLTLYETDGYIYTGQITYASLNTDSNSGYMPDAFDSTLVGSITKFLESFWFIVNPAADAEISSYVVPTITNTKYLPNTTISEAYEDDSITIKACASEYTSASFIIKSDTSLILDIETSLDDIDIDIKTVKCVWRGSYQPDYIYDVRGRYLIPQLLLHDDSIIKVDGSDWSNYFVTNTTGKNYLKLADGSYVDVSSATPRRTSRYVCPISERNFQDADTLQPVFCQADMNKQFWITIHVPDGTASGTYQGTIKIKHEDHVLKTLTIAVQVYDITLPAPRAEYSIFYRGTIRGSGSISSEDKTVEQYTAEQLDMLQHGVVNPCTYDYDTDENLVNMFAIRQEVGMDNTNWFLKGNIDPEDIASYKALLADYGVEEIYQYGPDEQDINTPEIRAEIEAIHAAGGKYHVAEYSSTYGDPVADILDVLIAGYLSPATAASYHSYGNRVFLYNHPLTVTDVPFTIRRNYGLMLWQLDYDGTTNYIYQNSEGDIWNDFDTTLRDFVFAYPTANGVIDTLKWEGFREGVNDMRYMAGLLDMLDYADLRGADNTEIKAWLLDLKSQDLSKVDLDEIRETLANDTIYVREHLPIEFYTADSQTYATADGNQLYLRVE